MNRRSSVLMIGCGCIGQGLIPLLLEYFDLRPDQVSAIAADEEGRSIAESYGVSYTNTPLTEANYKAILAGRLKSGDWLVNVSVDVSSLSLIEWSRGNGVLYLDTCVEPWAGGYRFRESVEATTNYALRDRALRLHMAGAPTAVIAHGANPGLVTHFVKAGLSELAATRGIRSWESWGGLANQLDIRSLHISERDTQDGPVALAPGEFANTWSVDGFIAECSQCQEMGWGSHERSLPLAGCTHQHGDQSGIYVERLGHELLVKSWVPSSGEQSALLIPHHESLSIANFLTIPGRSSHTPIYRPTVYYAYHPARLTQASLKQWQSRHYRPPRKKTILRDQLESGSDELGVLFLFPGGAYWYGSTLGLADARKLARHNNATSLQVVAGILGALEWMRKNPAQGVVEAESMDATVVLEAALPLLGKVAGVMSDWQPSPRRMLEFSEFQLSHCSKPASQKPRRRRVQLETI